MLQYNHKVVVDAVSSDMTTRFVPLKMKAKKKFELNPSWNSHVCFRFFNRPLMNSGFSHQSIQNCTYTLLFALKPVLLLAFYFRTRARSTGSSSRCPKWGTKVILRWGAGEFDRSDSEDGRFESGWLHRLYGIRSCSTKSSRRSRQLKLRKSVWLCDLYFYLDSIFEWRNIFW